MYFQKSVETRFIFSDLMIEEEKKQQSHVCIFMRETTELIEFILGFFMLSFVILMFTVFKLLLTFKEWPGCSNMADINHDGHP